MLEMRTETILLDNKEILLKEGEDLYGCDVIHVIENGQYVGAVDVIAPNAFDFVKEGLIAGYSYQDLEVYA